MFALCLATVVYQQSLPPPVSQGPAPMDQPGTEFPLVMGLRADQAGSGEQVDETNATAMMNTAVSRTPAAAAAENEALRRELDEARRALLHSSGGGSSPAAEVPGRALFPLESSPTSPTSIAEVTRVENEDFINKCISTITFQKQITAVTISASALAEMRSNLTMLINNFDNTMSKAEMEQILVSAMNVPGSAGKTKFNIPGKAVEPPHTK